MKVTATGAYLRANRGRCGTGRTLAAAGSNGKEVLAQTKGMKKTDVSKFVGQMIAKLALENNISSVVFDRNGYHITDGVKAVADAAREAGLKF